MHLNYYNKLLIAVGGEDLSKRKGCDYGIKFYDLTSGNIMYRLDGHYSWIECLINITLTKKSTHSQKNTYFNRKGNKTHYIASGSDDAQIKIWCMETLTCFNTLHGHSSFVMCLFHFYQISDKILLSGSEDKSIKIWNFLKGECLKTLKIYDAYIYTITGLGVNINAKNQSFASGSSDGLIRIYDYDILHDTAECIKTLEKHNGSIKFLLLVITIKLNVVISAGNDSLIKIWDYFTKENQCLHTLKGHVGELLYLERLISYHYNSFIASGGKDKQLMIWNVNSQQCIDVINLNRTIFSIISFHDTLRNWIGVGIDNCIHFVNVFDKINSSDEEIMNSNVKIVDLTSYSSSESLDFNLNIKKEDDVIKSKYKPKDSKKNKQYMKLIGFSPKKSNLNPTNKSSCHSVKTISSLKKK